MTKRSLAVLTTILVSGSAWADEGWEPRYVNADVANVRTEPRPTSEIVARLRINTHVLLHETRDGWSDVSWNDGFSGIGGVPEQRRRGFVRPELLGTMPLNLGGALDKARTALGSGKTREAVLWAERALAIDGMNPDARALLRAAYDEAGEDEKSGRLARNLDGREPAYLALCRGQRVEFLARHDPARGLVPVDVGSPSNPLPVGRDLGGLAWFSLTPDGLQQAVHGGQVSFPSVEPVHQSMEIGSSDPGKLVLGPCDQEGTLYSTAPLSPVEREEFDWSRVFPTMSAIREKTGLSGEGMSQARFVSVSASRFRTPVGWEATLTVEYPRPWGVSKVALWAVGREDGSILSALGSGGGESSNSVNGVWWGLLGHYRLAVAISNYSKEETGSSVSASVFVIDPQGRLRSLAVEVETTGC